MSSMRVPDSDDRPSPHLLRILCCPECRTGELRRKEEAGVSCRNCGQEYPVRGGVPFLFRAEALQEFLALDDARGPRPDNSVAGGAAHWREYEIERILPDPSHGPDILLLGCGDAGEKPYLASLGFRPVAFDIRRGAGTDFLSDAHRIGLNSETFDVVLSMQVLEHLVAPWEAVEEVARVLKPGGCFVGSVAFLKPYHGSYFHMTHAGVNVLCERAGLTVDHAHGAQSLTYTLYGGSLPIRSRRLKIALMSPFDRMLLALRARMWALSRRADPNEASNRFHAGLPMSFRQFDRVRSAPAVVFRAWKSRS